MKGIIMIVTTTNTIDGVGIVDYKGIVFGEVVEGINIGKDIAAAVTNFVGGRSTSYEKSIIKGRTDALEEMKKRAQDIGAEAIVGVKFDYEAVVEGMIMISCSGTAVTLTAPRG